ncbi:MAG: GGDEF domain-containing protein [Candidatus Izemoplasmatales bacterium]|nr:GGDEF domain-containing protein [Candidatus Izemoplasmatales bacterium]
MISKQFNQMKRKLKNNYGLDIVKDLILCDQSMIICFADFHDMDHIIFEVISGSLEIIGFTNQSRIPLSVLFEHFYYNHGYAKIAGKNEYFNQIKQELFDFEKQPITTFPIQNDQGIFWIRIQLIPINNHPQLVTVFITNVSSIMVEEEKMFSKTHQDSLTGVFNRYTLDYHYGIRYLMDQFHVMFLDIDNFKLLNDQMGHHAGNQFLEEFASILKSYEENYNCFYRIGGDEFVGLFFEETKKVIQITEEIIQKTKQLALKFEAEFASVSIGVVEAQMREDVVRKADKLLYEAKKLGKNQYVFAQESKIKK